MTKILCTLTASDDNNLIVETRGRRMSTKVIARNDDTAKNLLATIDEAFEANKPPTRETAPVQKT